MRLGITNLSLLEVVKHYFGYDDSDFDKQGRFVHLTKCPIHKEKKGTSLSIYDKTSEGKGWDWYCHGTCHTGGTAPKLLVEAGLFNTIEEAVKDLRTTFKLEYPEYVDLKNFAELKGFDVEFLKSRGIDNHIHIHNGEYVKGVSIPYYDASGNVIAVKKRLKFEGSGKYMFTEGSNTVYGLDLLKTYTPDRLYICEGETDTLTMLQAGLQAVGLPGAASWQEEWKSLFDKFTEIVCLSDNDKAGIELMLKLGKDFPDKLYTVNFPRRFNDVNEYFLYGCAGNKETLHKYFTTQPIIPATPDTFKEMVKKDASILSNTAAWYNVLLYKKDEVSQMLFVEELKANTKVNKNIISKAFKEAITKFQTDKKEKEESDANIFIKDNCYYKRVFTDNGVDAIPISNFIIQLIHTVEAEGNHVRICKLVNDQGKISRLIRFDSDTLTKPVEFMSECKKAGNYIFKGDFKDLISLNEIILKQEDDVVHAPDHIGRVGKAWLMGRYGVDSNGNVIDADEHGIINLDDKRYMVRNLNIVDETDETYMPSRPDDEEITTEYLTDVVKTMYTNLGGYEAWLSLGFTVAGWYSNEIYSHRNEKSFPIFFIAGKRNSGKTILARWLMSAYGFPHIEGKNFAMPSVVSMTRKLGYYSSLPQWYDDYRNEIKDIKYRNEFMLGAYNRQGADKGLKSGFGVRSEAIRGFLLISGEDTPDDNAVTSRCTIIHVSSYDRDDALYPHMLDLVTKFPAMGLYFLKEKQKNGAAELLNRIDAVQHQLMSHGIDARLARNTAVFAGSFLYAFGKCLTEQEVNDFMKWLNSNTVSTKAQTEEDHTITRFFSDLAVLIADGKLKNGHHFKVEDNNIYLWFKACYDVWTQEYRGVDIKRAVLMSYIVKEPYFVEKNRLKRLSVNTPPVRTLVIDYTKVPDSDFMEYCASADDTDTEF